MGYSQADLDAAIARGPVPEKPQLSEEEFEQMMRAEWVAILSSMWLAIGKPVEDRRLNIYVQSFLGVPLGLLQAAISRTLREAGDYNLVPTIGAVWGALRKELHNPLDLEDEIKRWCEAKYQNMLHRFG
jgi:hypothetical protein